MRAKFSVVSIQTHRNQTDEIYQEDLVFQAVTETPFDENGNSEDNTFAKWTPTGHLSMSIQNPNLFGKFYAGQKFYLDFTPVPGASVI
jgi:hypothetical protein